MAQKIRYYKKDGTEYSFSKEPEIKITQTSNADMNIGVTKSLTAVEWLKELWDKQEPFEKFIQPEQFEQAKQMEKQQIMDAYLEGESDAEHLDNSAEQYYNEIFNK